MTQSPPPVQHEWFGPLPPNVAIGGWSTLYSSYAFVHCESSLPQAVRVGHHTGIYWGSFFDLGPHGSAEIGDYTTLASPIVSTNGPVRIGSHCLFAWGSVVADSFAAVPPDARPDAGESAPIVIEDNVWVGARSAVIGGVRVGEGAIIAACAIVDFDVEPYAVVAGDPARIVGHRRPTRER